VKTRKSRDNENNFPKSIAAEQAHEVSTTRNDTWWNAYSTPSQRRCVFTQPRPISDLVRVVHHPASGAELPLSRMRAKIHGLSRERCVALRDCDWPRSVRRPLAMATRKPRADYDRVASNDNRRKDWCREHSVGLHSTADLLTTCLWSSNPSLPMASAELVG
jgi:hypothetical protein